MGFIVNVDQVTIGIAFGTKRENDKMITILVGITMDGTVLPLQIIYSGENKNCIPIVNFPSLWHITYTLSLCAYKLLYHETVCETHFVTLYQV